MKYAALALLCAAAAFLGSRALVRREPARAPADVWSNDYERYRTPARVEVQWRENRGHAFSLKDRDENAVPKLRPVPGGCLICHAAGGQFEKLSYYELRERVREPIGCEDCHQPHSAGLRLTRPALLAGRTGDLRVLVCAQCHGEYYFEKGEVARPWSRGLRAEDIEAHYDALGYSDHPDPRTGTPLLAIRHPQFEMWSQGTHAAAGVACADCHMPRERRGAMRVTDHRAGSPLAAGARACAACHREAAREMLERARAIQQRTERAMARAEAAMTAGGPLRRKAQLRLDMVRSDGSRGFHAPHEALRLLGEATDFARQAQIEAAR
ncbi:MAG: ammonia-forming cytochrome c nitrite reductase subunit c552 [Bryobacteraceae bacterium]